MDLLQLKYFKDAAFFENFSKAAEENMVPQSSISKAVKILETEYNAPLFDRIGKSIYLNDNGKFLYQEVCGIFDRLDSCEHHFARIKPNHIIAYIQDSAFFVPLLSADYMEKNRQTYVTFSNAAEILHSTKSPYDVTFMPLIDDMSHYEYEELLTDDMILLVSKDHPFAQYDEIEASMLKGEPIISFYVSMWLRTLSDRICRELGGFEPYANIETHDEFVAIHLVAHNKGIAMLPEKLYKVHPHSNVKAVKIKNTLSTTTVIAWHLDKHLSKSEQDFIRFAKDWYKNLPSFNK